jgi:hypothetical protein
VRIDLVTLPSPEPLSWTSESGVMSRRARMQAWRFERE